MNEIIKNKKKSEILAEEIAKRDYGSVITHFEISEIIHESYPSQKYITVIQQAKKILTGKYGKILESIRGDGYRIIEPDDYVNDSLRHYKKGFNEIKKGTQTLEHAPQDKMSPEARTTYRQVSDRSRMLYASLKGAVVEIKTLSEKKHPFLPEHIGDR